MRSWPWPAFSLLALASLAGGACGHAPSLPQPAAPAWNPKDETRCGVAKSQAEPLIVEWPSAARAKLEASARRGLVAVRFAGCEMQVLGQCKVPGRYGYTPLTTKKDVVRIRDADELYASIPVYADRFERALARTGELDVEMTIVGRFEADRLSVRVDELDGWCEGATHFVTGLTAGAFEFYAGSGAARRAKGAPATSALERTTREVLTEDGDDAHCARASGGDKAPPEGCSALIRVEVVPFGVPARRAALCPPGSQESGGSCVIDQMVVNLVCPAGTTLDAGSCVPRVSTSCPPGLYFATGVGCLPRESAHATPRSGLAASRAASAPSAELATSRAESAELVSTRASAPAPRRQAVGHRLVPLPGGTFTMGSDDGPADERPAHAVSVRAFAIDDTEVTVGAYDACVRFGHCRATANTQRCNGGHPDRADHPINCVTWEEAMAYCDYAGGSLPTEEEWEYAARGGSSRRYPWGDDAPADNVCWSFVEGRETTCPVGSFRAGDTAAGVHDLLGDVYEWTGSKYCSYAEATCADVRIYRGGSWQTDRPERLRPSTRNWATAGYQDEALGFRCVHR